MHRKYTAMKNAMSVYGGHRPVERDPSHPDFQSIASKYQHDPERSRQRMRMREERLKARESYDLEEGHRGGCLRQRTLNNAAAGAGAAPVSNKSFRYMRRQPTLVLYDEVSRCLLKFFPILYILLPPGRSGWCQIHFGKQQQ